MTNSYNIYKINFNAKALNFVSFITKTHKLYIKLLFFLFLKLFKTNLKAGGTLL
jgi:hypothetical protein